METVTLYDLMQEMETWYKFTPEELELAKKSKLTTANNKDLKRLYNGWVGGYYDEDPEALCLGLIVLTR
jgi:hypothetical protein